MEKLLLCVGLMLSLLAVSVHTTAQETSDIETEWPIERHCLGEPVSAGDRSFDGTIFTLESDGVHAIREGVATPYYVAFSSDTELGVRGTLSPDGRWFAVPAGQTSRYGPGGQFVFDIREIRVYSTDGRRELHRARGVGIVTEGISAFYSVTPPQWIDNEHLIYYSYDDPWLMLVIVVKLYSPNV